MKLVQALAVVSTELVRVNKQLAQWRDIGRKADGAFWSALEVDAELSNLRAMARAQAQDAAKPEVELRADDSHEANEAAMEASTYFGEAMIDGRHLVMIEYRAVRCHRCRTLLGRVWRAGRVWRYSIGMCRKLGDIVDCEDRSLAYRGLLSKCESCKCAS